MSDSTATVEEVPADKIEWIAGFPTPPTPPIRPLHALVSVFRLVRNKEDTRQVFEIFQALAGGASKRLFARFVATPYGRRVITQPVRLEEVLTDHEALRALPEGSLGRAYLDFMEGENLTADGLIDAAEEAGIDFRGETQFEDYRRLFLHLDVSHDLWHVLSGYGRDALGELCNLIYTRAQTRTRGIRFIVFIGALAQKLDRPSAPVLKALAEARRNVRGTAWAPEFDVEEMLPLQLAEVRQRMNITEPVFYNAIPDEVKDNLLKPKVNETQAERERLHNPEPAL